MKFTSEIEDNNCISFLDIKISRVNNSFSTNLYCNVTFNGVFKALLITNFESFVPISYKSSLIFLLLFRAFKLCSNFELFHQERLNLKDIFKRNGYPWYNHIQTVLKHLKLYILTQIVCSINYSIAEKFLANICCQISKIRLILWMV